ncbi:MAG: Fe-S protein assembly chaperone HscA [Phycisphaerales bacterium]|nr:Fe-S protein assembly chaperone HscA [Phycisphaerales bacterium]
MNQSTDPELIVGIDLGTTNSLVAFCGDRGPRVLLDGAGQALLPSIVRIDADGQMTIGREARDHAVEFPRQTVHSVKRLMGQTIDQVRGDLDYLSYEVTAGEGAAARVRVHDRLLSPQEISAAILARLREIAQTALQRPVAKAVITVPAYFDDAQRQATRDAGRFAGLDVARIINEPTAAALAYGIGRSGEPETIAVYDLGGGTFDISILQIIPPSGADASIDSAFFQVRSTAGDTHLGGDDVDRLIVELVQREIRDQHGVALEFPPSTRQALRRFAEATKIRLSSEDSAPIQIDLGDGRTYERTISRDEFEAMITPWVERTIEACRRALRDARLAPGDIDRVVMVGGSTRIPLVRQRVGAFFESNPYTAIDPDQVVALGAAVQAAILSGAHQSALLLDVIPLSLGIETMGGAMAKLIMRNSTVPCQATERFSTSVDGQTSIKIHVLQGERELVSDCRSLGEFHLRGIPPMPAGIPQLEVSFHIDVNGILDVTAVERRSGKRAAVQIVANHGLTAQEVDRIERDSISHARSDMKLHRIIDLRVNAALDLKWICDAIKRVESEIPADYRRELDARIATLQRFVDDSELEPQSVNADAFHAAKEELDRASVRLHELSIARSLRDEG